MHAPTGEYPNFNIALSLELIYSVVYFGLIVLPYRYLVSNDESKTTLLLWRTALPAVTYFFWMIAFVFLRYPASLHDRTWIQVRGFYAGIIMMFCFCAGMFL